MVAIPLNSVATVLTACGIETVQPTSYVLHIVKVATVLTACGIETMKYTHLCDLFQSQLQQYLPLAVLKLSPLMNNTKKLHVATVLTACGIETRVASDTG